MILKSKFKAVDFNKLYIARRLHIVITRVFYIWRENSPLK